MIYEANEAINKGYEIKSAGALCRLSTLYYYYIANNDSAMVMRFESKGKLNEDWPLQ